MSAYIYDHIAFHFDNEFPPDLSEKNAVHHMGFYFAWAVSQQLHHPDWESATPDFAKLQNGSISGPDFMLQHMGGELTDADFNNTGNRFTQYYYEDEDEGYGLFLEDYFLTLGIDNEAAFYHTTDHADTQARLSPIFQQRYQAWRTSLNG